MTAPSPAAIKVSREAQAIGQRLFAHLQEITGLRAPLFVLVIYTDGRATYIRDLDRDSTLVTLAALLAVWGHPPAEPLPSDVLMDEDVIWQLSERSLRKLQANAKKISERLSADIAAVAGEPLAWSLVLPTPHRPSYLGACSREDAIRELSDLLALLLAGMPEIPAHEVTQ